MTEPTEIIEPVEAAAVRAPSLRIEIDHTQFYQWVPVPEGNVFDDTVEDAGECPPGMVKLSDTIESTFPGMRQYRATVTVEVPTTSITDVDLSGVAAWNDERELAGLDRRPHRVNLIQHFVDGPWSRQFPISSITDIRCDDARWQQWLRDYFLSDGDDDYLGGF